MHNEFVKHINTALDALADACGAMVFQDPSLDSNKIGPEISKVAEKLMSIRETVYSVHPELKPKFLAEGEEEMASLQTTTQQIESYIANSQLEKALNLAQETRSRCKSGFAEASYTGIVGRIESLKKDLSDGPKTNQSMLRTPEGAAN